MRISTHPDRLQRSLCLGADGSLRDRWPTNLGAVPDGSYPEPLIYPRGGYYPSEQPPQTAPGGVNALNCPFVGNTERTHRK